MSQNISDTHSNVGADPSTTDTAAPTPSLRDRVAAVIEDHINPAVAMHGGFVQLVEVKDTAVYVAMGGGCQGCAASQMTLQSGIEAMIMEEVPEVTEVIDTTDHNAGQNPFFAE